MENIAKAMQHINQGVSDLDTCSTIPFEEFLKVLIAKPTIVIRNVFQLFHDMIKNYVGEGVDEYPDDPESIDYVHYDCSRLFIKDADHPFFADRLFANRLINLVESLKRGAQQNKIYIFEGPHGCGKSTFLNNLLLKFEEYANTENGVRFETVWRLNRKLLGGAGDQAALSMYEKLFQMQATSSKDQFAAASAQNVLIATDNYIEVPCPSHDNPLLVIPKQIRRPFFDDLFQNNKFKWKLFTEKEYDWVFRDNPCTICSSLYQSLLNQLKDPLKVFKMLHARSYHFNRRLGKGISVFNPGDKPMRQSVFSNAMLQNRINSLLTDGDQFRYYYSRYAKTNNGIYALMDIKSYNTERLIELHNIVSEGVHKIEDIEENVSSLFLALMNPEDKKNIKDFQSFSDRIEYINIPYVLDLDTEVEIYRNVFGKHIDTNFLPWVLNNFARVVISSRLNVTSNALLEWIGDPSKYRRYCDENLQLLKMEIYRGQIPLWLFDEDRKKFTSKRRRKIIAESEMEGDHGFSGRDSIKIFNEFYSAYAKENRLINMSDLYNYFKKIRKDLNESIPEGFLDSLLRMYNYTILQEVKESLYYFNEEQISKDIQNYLFAINFEIGTVEFCKFTGEKITITDHFLESIENHVLGHNPDYNMRLSFREDILSEYTSRTLTQEVMLEGKSLTESTLYQSMHDRYVYNLKEKVLDPFIKNVNFRRAIKDYHTRDFKAYDKKIRNDVKFLIDNLCNKYAYTDKGARDVCMYVVDMELAKTMSDSDYLRAV